MSAKTDQSALDSRYPALRGELGERPADALTPLEIERALSKLATEREWAPVTANRHQPFLPLGYRPGVQNGLVAQNPCRAVRRRREDNGRIRYLLPEEETRLRAEIRRNCPEYGPLQPADPEPLRVRPIARRLEQRTHSGSRRDMQRWRASAAGGVGPGDEPRPLRTAGGGEECCELKRFARDIAHRVGGLQALPTPFHPAHS